MSARAEEPADAFARERSRLFGIAYRMLGSVAEAEDVVQEAYLRWHRVDADEVRNARAWLTRVVTRLCLDVLGSARMRREQYVGPWLPEPLVGHAFGEQHDVTVALMLALERLSPLERAAFLLHDVFGLPFDEVGIALDREPAACRQLASRARRHVRAARPRFEVPEERGREIADAFFHAAREGDLDGLRAVLAEDAVLYTDGGGNAPAALNLVEGGERIARFFAGLALKPADRDIEVLYLGPIDGLPGVVVIGRDGLLQATSVEIGPDGVCAIYAVRNPDKLRHLRDLVTGAAGSKTRA